MAKKKKTDEKSAALQENHALNPHPETVVDDLFREGGFFDPRDMVQVKYEMLRRVHKDRKSASQSAQAFGFSRPSFYQSQAAFEKDGLAGLLPQKRGPQHSHKLTGEVMDYIEQLRLQDHELNSSGLADRVNEKFGVSVHPRSIERALEKRKKKRQPPRTTKEKRLSPSANGSSDMKPSGGKL